MISLPEKLINSLHGVKGFDEEAFRKVHISGEQITSVRINPLKIPGSLNDLSFGNNLSGIVLWTTYGYYLSERPSFTFDPLFHAGAYYVQEASSMFLEQALKQTTDLSRPLKVLDLCAAPGGKSTHIQSLLSKESLLVSNDVIRSRANILKDNITKWGASNVVVTNNDPRDFSRLENYFDIIVADAPCSGSGLFRRDPEAINEWSENNVQLCAQRQQRIIADVWPSLKKEGVLIYSTCSYSREEDEAQCKWIQEELSAEQIKLQIDHSWGIVETEAGYRFWPDKVKGEGFFITCFRKMDGEENAEIRVKEKPDELTKKEIAIAEKWVKKEGLVFIKYLNTVYAWPESLYMDLAYLLKQLRVIYSGTIAGELIRDKIIPDHALAMSNIISDAIGKTELNYEQAIRYLQRKDLQLDAKQTGWQVITFNRHLLGWINILPSRINNYYPKELRILKEN